MFLCPHRPGLKPETSHTAFARSINSALSLHAKVLQLEYVGVLHEALLVHLLLYGIETMIWKEKERSKIRAMKMDNLRHLLVTRRMD